MTQNAKDCKAKCKYCNGVATGGLKDQKLGL